MSSSFAFLLLCIQACLVQNAFAQSLVGLPNYNAFGYSTDVDVLAYSNSEAALAAYGFNGIGLPLAGSLDYNAGLAGLAGTNIVSNTGLGLGLNGGLGLGYGNAGYVTGGYGGFAVPDVAAVSSLPVTGPYIGNGFAELAIGGTLGAAGTTIVTGQLPVLGTVSFSGEIPARGVVSIAGNCGCGGLVL